MSETIHRDSEHKDADDELRRGEKYLRALIENATDIITILNADGIIRYESPSIERVLGFKPHELVGLNGFDFVHPKDRARVVEVFTRRVEGETIFPPTEYRFRHKDGSWRTLESIGNNLLDDELVGGVVVNSRDITERKRAEAELQAYHSELLALHRISELTLNACSVEDCYPPIVEEISAATRFPIIAVEIYDARRQVMVFVGVKGIPLPDGGTLEVPVSETLSGTVARTGQPVNRTFAPGETKDSDANETLSRLGIRTFVCVPMYVNERVIGVLSLAHTEVVHGDESFMRLVSSLANHAAALTERKRVEEALREGEERFRRYFELGLIGMAITSPTKAWLEVNDQTCRILGYERDELFNRSWEELTHPDDVAADVENFDRVMAGEMDAYSMEKRWIRKDGKIIDTIISVKALRRADKSVDYFVGLLQDITERKRLEEQLRQAQKLEAVGRLAGGVAHDFNNMLTAINGYSELLLKSLSDVSARSRVEEIRKAGVRAADLTQQLLAFSRKQVLQPKIVTVNEIVADMKRMLERVIGEDVRLLTALSPHSTLR